LTSIGADFISELAAAAITMRLILGEFQVSESLTIIFYGTGIYRPVN